MKKHLLAVVLFAVMLALDIISKMLVVAHIGPHERIDILGSFVQFTILYNRGGIFGIMQGHQTFFLIVSVVVLGLLSAYYFFEKNKTALFSSAMAFILAGAIGNILDRIMQKPGVVDFILIGDDRIYRWPTFNVADASIVIGAGLLLIFYFLEERKRKAEKPEGQ